MTTLTVSPQEYLEFEEMSEERHEYIDGLICPMPGELRRHNEVAGTIYTSLRSVARKQQCSIAMEGIKLWFQPSTVTIILTLWCLVMVEKPMKKFVSTLVLSLKSFRPAQNLRTGAKSCRLTRPLKPYKVI
jgi:Putative restriction endonuclease